MWPHPEPEVGEEEGGGRLEQVRRKRVGRGRLVWQQEEAR